MVTSLGGGDAVPRVLSRVPRKEPSSVLKEVRIRLNGDEPETRSSESSSGLHPAWRELVRFCEELGFGEIESLKIQDGLPVLAEVTRKKVKFGT